MLKLVIYVFYFKNYLLYKYNDLIVIKKLFYINKQNINMYMYKIE